jgi:hypothetical protein
MKRIVAAIVAAVFITGCGGGAPSADITLCHEYLTWLPNQTTNANHLMAHQMLYGAGKQATNPVKRAIARAMVYAVIGSSAQSSNAVATATRNCHTIGVEGK